MSVLDCETIESLECSLESILNIPIRNLKMFLLDLDTNRLESKIILDINCIETVLLEEVITKFKIKPSFDATCWFHLTRTSRPEDFKKGIYPLGDIISTIWNDLYLCIRSEFPKQKWLEFKNAFESGQLRSPCSQSYRLYTAKMNRACQACQGPFAVLIKDVSLMPRGYDTNDYLDAPETVRDICTCFERIYNIDLFRRYLNNTHKYVIKFKSDEHEARHLGYAIIYLYKIIHQKRIGPYDNRFFGGNGHMIPPENIMKIIPINTI
ncbi:MAG TPA: hypothetical protein PLX30_06415 [Methanothrix sp.]|nr:hypothetical protein [Methanothrix sp.]